MKRQRVIPYPRLMKLAVQAFNGWVRRRDKACVLCGKSRHLTASHLISAQRTSTRFDPFNVWAMCARENFRHNRFPEIYTRWFLRNVGEEKYHALVLTSLSPKKHTRAELHQIIEKYS